MSVPIAPNRRRELGPAAASLAAAGLPAAATAPAPMLHDGRMLLATGLAGSLLIGLSGQLVGPNIGGIAAAIGATAGAASWLSAAYIMALLAGIVVSVALIPALGVRRHMMASALLFALAALGCALEPSLPAMVGLRAVQGFAAGAFGPIAFVAVFMTTGGPRLPLGLALLAFVLLLPASFGPAAAGFLAASFGWEALFLAQATIGGLLLGAAMRWMPRSPLSRAALDRDWTAVLLLGVALAATVVVLTQGASRDWFESDLIVGSTATAVTAWVGFAVNVWRSLRPIIDIGLLARPAFIRPIALYLFFRAGLGATAFLVPQFLVLVHDYQPLDVAELFLWPSLAQLTAFPLVWWLLQRIDGRPVIAAGLLSLGLALFLIADANLAAGELRLALALAGAAQIMFLVPNLIAGAGPLKPADGPTASLVFNAMTVGGTTLGAALATEAIAAGGGVATAAASFTGAFQFTAALLILSAAGVLLLVRQPALRGASAPSAAAAYSRPIG